MARSPKSSLDDLAVPKAAPDTPQETLADLPAPKAYSHTLSLRLTADDYRGLRRYVAEQEERMGKRITHQAVLETLLRAFLSDHGKR